MAQSVLKPSPEAVTWTWNRLPVIVQAALMGLAAAAAGTMPWAAMVSANMRALPAFPWAAPIMAVYLVAYWRYFVRGRGWPAWTADARRASARANDFPGEAWGPALLAGILGLVSVLLLQGVLGRLVELPQQRDLEITRYPMLSVATWVGISAVVAGVVEETAFRGYMQRPIERRHGVLAAILVSGSVFGLMHFTHPEVANVLLPYYVAVAAVYGMLAYLLDSTIPSMALHIFGNVFSAFNLFARGRSEWQPAGRSSRLVWQTGLDGEFVISIVAFLLIGGMAVAAFAGLARIMRDARRSQRAYDQR